MSTNDRAPRSDNGKASPFLTPRIDPGENVLNPKRVPLPDRLSTPIPRGPDLTKPEKQRPVSR
jgi:hypothetical protein